MFLVLEKILKFSGGFTTTNLSKSYFLSDASTHLFPHYRKNSFAFAHFHANSASNYTSNYASLDVKGVFYLKSVNEDKLVERIQRRAIKENRLDDANLDVIRGRLKVYEQETKPVLSFYGNQIVHQINADQKPAKVLCDILGFLV